MRWEDIMAPVLECQGNDKSSFDYYSKKMSRSHHGKQEYEIKRHNANTKTLRTNSWRNQFIAGLTSDALRVKLIGKGHRHETTQAKVKLREVVEVAKTIETTTFANQLLKTARNTQQEQVNYTTKSLQLSQCFWCGWKHQQPRHQHCPAMGKKCGKRGMATTRAYMQGWNTMTSSTATIQFCLWRHRRGNLRYGVWYNLTVFEKIFFESAP